MEKEREAITSLVTCHERNLDALLRRRWMGRVGVVMRCVGGHGYAVLLFPYFLRVSFSFLRLFHRLVPADEYLWSGTGYGVY